MCIGPGATPPTSSNSSMITIRQAMTMTTTRATCGNGAGIGITLITYSTSHRMMPTMSS